MLSLVSRRGVTSGAALRDAQPCACTMRSRSRTASRIVVVRADKQDGFVTEDNSGRGNIFPTKPAAYVSSPTTTQVASSGIGGTGGIITLLAALGAVGAATVFLSQSNLGPENLESVASSYSGDSLTTIAARIAKTV